MKTPAWPRRVLRRDLMVIFVLALAIRLLYVAAVLEAQDAPELRRFNGDSKEYLRLGEQLATHGSYTADDDVYLQVIGLVRTPLYPAIVAAALKLESFAGLTPTPDTTDWHISRIGPGGKAALAGLFLVQAFCDALLAVLAAKIAWHLWRRRWSALVAGAFMAFCPTGWGLSAVVLTDGLFAFFVGLALWLTLRAARRRSWPTTLAAGAVWSLAILAKPTLTFFPFALPIIWWLAARPRHSWRTTFQWRVLAQPIICILMLAGTTLAWTLHNKHTADVFAFSIVKERNLRFMFGPNVEVRAATGSEPRALVRERYYTLGHQDRRWLAEPDMTPAEFVRRQREYIQLVIEQFPGLMARQYVHQLETNIVGHWDILINQLPPRDKAEPLEIGGMGAGGEWTPLARRIFGPFFKLDATKIIRWTCFALAVLAPLIPALGRNRRALRLALAIWLVALYFLLTSATTHSQGSRILYPAYAPAAVLIAGWGTLQIRRTNAEQS